MGEITVISREEGSGTRGAFIELFGVEEKDANGNKVDHTTEEALIANKTDVVITQVAASKSAIGYISLGSLNDTVKALKVDGVDATAENVSNGTYSIARPFNIATKGTPSEVAQDFIDFILSADGQRIVSDNNYIPVDANAATYAGTKPNGKIVVAGSSSVSPLMEKLQEAYLALNPNATIEIQTSDSTTGMQSTMSGICDIGMASRELKDSELAELTPIVIAKDGIAMIVNKENSLDNISSETVKEIYTGVITDWADVA
nr:substrate-binding domain-containing protein [Papillibacter cinnamivorans]